MEMYKKVVIDEGNDVASFSGKSLKECKRACTDNKLCHSFAFVPAPDQDNKNCYLKDKKLRGSEPTKYSKDWMTYYDSC